MTMENSVFALLVTLCLGYSNGTDCGYKVCRNDTEYCDDVTEYCVKCDHVCRNSRQTSLESFCFTMCPVYMSRTTSRPSTSTIATTERLVTDACATIDVTLPLIVVVLFVILIILSLSWIHRCRGPHHCYG